MSNFRDRVGRRAAKMSRNARSIALTPWLAFRAARSGRLLIDTGGSSVVSLTTYGDRLRTVHLTIEAIGAGRARPRQLILWTDPYVDLGTLPPQLLRLRARGLEIRQSPADIGPHKKYFPYVLSRTAHDLPLVTADDDTIYPRGWLAGLEAIGEAYPKDVVCYRAHLLAVTAVGSIAPYNEWLPVTRSDSSPLHFATGGSGVRYPAAFLDDLRLAGDGFVDRCPRADDVWLHARAVAAGRQVRQVGRRPREFPEIAGTQVFALHRTNTAHSGNDVQIAATYDEAMLAILHEAIKPQ